MGWKGQLPFKKSLLLNFFVPTESEVIFWILWYAGIHYGLVGLCGRGFEGSEDSLP